MNDMTPPTITNASWPTPAKSTTTTAHNTERKCSIIHTPTATAFRPPIQLNSCTIHDTINQLFCPKSLLIRSRNVSHCALQKRTRTRHVHAHELGCDRTPELRSRAQHHLRLFDKKTIKRRPGPLTTLAVATAVQSKTTAVQPDELGCLRSHHVDQRQTTMHEIRHKVDVIAEMDQEGV